MHVLRRRPMCIRDRSVGSSILIGVVVGLVSSGKATTAVSGVISLSERHKKLHNAI